ncbi:hypothetical protein Tco_0689114 [Tanacetum coccineum]
MESDEFIKSSVENLVPTPSESEDASNELILTTLIRSVRFILVEVAYDKRVPSPSWEDSNIPMFSDAITESFSPSPIPSDIPIRIPEHESFTLQSDYDPSSPHPLAKPPDDDEIKPDTGLLTTKVVGEISKHYVLMPRLLPTQPTLCPVIQTSLPFSSKNVDKVLLLSHRGFKALQLSSKSPMIHGDNTPNLGVRHLHFYPP